MAQHQTRLTLFTLGLIASAALVTSGTPSAAQDRPAATIELSAQSDSPNANKKNQPQGKTKTVPQGRTNVQPRQNIQRQQLNVQQNQQNIKRRQTDLPQNQRRLQQNNQIRVQKDINIQKKVIVAPQGSGQRKFVGQPRKFTPKHNNLVYKFKLRGANQAFVSGKNYSVFRNNYRVRRNGRLYTFVALGLLAPLAIGAATYYPYAYLDVPADYCEGLTEDGCEMVYNEVETVDGDLVPQCTAYCPWQ
jgi:hypothetical protein